MVQESGHGLATRLTIKVLARDKFSCEDSTGERSASKFTDMIVGKI